MSPRLLRLRLRRSLILIPSLYVVAALVLGEVIPNLDKSGRFPLRIDVDIQTAHDILTATATGMLAFTGLVVSSMLLVVQFAASQYSPRLVLWFRRDPLVKHAIGSFLAASVYPIVALRELNPQAAAVPDITVAFSLGLVVGASILFLALLERVLDRLRPRNLLGAVLRDGIAAGASIYPQTLGPDPAPPADDWRREKPQTIRMRTHHGVLASFDRDPLVHAAKDAGVTVEIVPSVGEYLSPGDPLFRVHGGTIPDRFAARALVVSDERTIEQDPACALRIMVDTAIRALSPRSTTPRPRCRASMRSRISSVPWRAVTSRRRWPATTRASCASTGRRPRGTPCSISPSRRSGCTAARRSRSPAVCAPPWPTCVTRPTRSATRRSTRSGRRSTRRRSPPTPRAPGITSWRWAPTGWASA